MSTFEEIEEEILSNLNLFYLLKLNKQIKKKVKKIMDKRNIKNEGNTENVKLIIDEDVETENNEQKTLKQIIPHLNNMLLNKELLFTKINDSIQKDYS